MKAPFLWLGEVVFSSYSGIWPINLKETWFFEKLLAFKDNKKPVRQKNIAGGIQT